MTFEILLLDTTWMGRSFSKATHYWHPSTAASRAVATATVTWVGLGLRRAHPSNWPSLVDLGAA